jgi:hypothetical protein
MSRWSGPDLDGELGVPACRVHDEELARRYGSFGEWKRAPLLPPWRVYFWSNGCVMTFDKSGQQIPELQADSLTAAFADRLEPELQPNTEFFEAGTLAFPALKRVDRAYVDALLVAARATPAQAI